LDIKFGLDSCIAIFLLFIEVLITNKKKEEYMKTIKLVNGVVVPLLGLGTLRSDKSEPQVETILEALKLGYRHIDTAQMYFNESDVGEAIKKSKIDRKEIFVTTKQKDYHDGDKAKIKQGVLESLKRLQLEYVDLLLIHWPHHIQKYIEITWSVFEELYHEGKAKAIGVSNFTRFHLNELAKTAKIMPMVNQVELHPGLQQWPLQKFCDKLNIVLTSYGPFMKGRVFEEGYKETLEVIAQKHKASIAQVICAWGIQRNVIMIPKSANERRMAENLNSVNITLDDEDMTKIMGLNKGHKVYTDPDNNPSFPYF